MSHHDQHKFEFKAEIENLIQEVTPFKITFSKPKHQNKDVINVYLKTAMIKNELQYSLTHRYRTRDEVKNYTASQIMEVIDTMLDSWFDNAVLFTASKEITLLQSKKGKATIIRKKAGNAVTLDTNHDHQKVRMVPEKTPWLQALGLAGQDGKVFDKSQDKYRQINKYVEIIDHLTADVVPDSLITIADMGSGKGYLTFALYEHLVNNRKLRPRMTGYEIRQDLVTQCYHIAMNEGFVGLTFQQKNIEEADVRGADMVIALHACDIATDMAIAKGIEAGARFILVSPCCHKQVRQSMHHDNVLSPILKHGILEERQAEIITDGIRALIMEAKGYRTQVFEFISTEHTGKNLMITGVKGKPDPSAMEKVEAIKKYFGLEYHHLEKLV